jgi:hypothetical protein
MRIVAQWADGSAVESVLLYALVGATLGAVVLLSAFTITRIGRVHKRLDELSGEKDRYIYENDALRRRLDALVGADGSAPAGDHSFTSKTSKSSSAIAPPYVAVQFSPTNAPLMPGMRSDVLEASVLSRGGRHVLDRRGVVLGLRGRGRAPGTSPLRSA